MKTIILSTACAIALAASLATPALSQQTPGQAVAVKRTADGKPDFSGTWTFRPPAAPRAADPRGLCVGPRCGAGPEAAGIEPPRVTFPKYKDEHKAKIDKLNKEQVTFDPALRCENPGIPRVGTPDKILQTADQIVFLYDDLNGSFWRIIPTDGRAHREDAEEGPFGDSVGRWDGDTLVIETIALGEDTWLTDNGAFHTYNMKTVEELKFTPAGGLDYKITVNDPDVLAEPYVKQRTVMRASKELLQPPVCVERSIDKMVGIESYHPNPRW